MFGASGLTCAALERDIARMRELTPEGPFGVNAQLAQPTPATGERARILAVLKPFRRELGLPDEPPEPAQGGHSGGVDRVRARSRRQRGHDVRRSRPGGGGQPCGGCAAAADGDDGGRGPPGGGVRRRRGHRPGQRGRRASRHLWRRRGAGRGHDGARAAGRRRGRLGEFRSWPPAASWTGAGSPRRSRSAPRACRSARASSAAPRAVRRTPTPARSRRRRPTVRS